MAKKNTKIVAELDTQLMENMFQYSVTVEGLARATGVKVGKLRKAATTPIEGKVYDPNEINYARLAFVMGADIIAGIDWEEAAQPAARTGAKDENILRNAEALEFNVNYYIRGKAVPVQIVYADISTQQFVIKTVTEPKDTEQEPAETLQVVKFSRFLAKAPRLTPRAVGPAIVEE